MTIVSLLNTNYVQKLSLIKTCESWQYCEMS